VQPSGYRASSRSACARSVVAAGNYQAPKVVALRAKHAPERAMNPSDLTTWRPSRRRLCSCRGKGAARVSSCPLAGPGRPPSIPWSYAPLLAGRAAGRCGKARSDEPKNFLCNRRGKPAKSQRLAHQPSVDLSDRHRWLNDRDVLRHCAVGGRRHHLFQQTVADNNEGIDFERASEPSRPGAGVPRAQFREASPRRRAPAVTLAWISTEANHPNVER
jgi:hypothetical protein